MTRYAQIYSLTVTDLGAGLFLGLFAVLEWPKDAAPQPDADQVPTARARYAYIAQKPTDDSR